MVTENRKSPPFRSNAIGQMKGGENGAQKGLKGKMCERE